jgi:hypothetical protein
MVVTSGGSTALDRVTISDRKVRVMFCSVAYPGFFRGWGLHQEFFRGDSTNSVRIEGRENGDLGAAAPYSGVPLNLQMNETHILIMLLRMYIPWNWEFGSALAKPRNFGGGGVEPPKPPIRYATGSVVLLLLFLFTIHKISKCVGRL